MGSTQREEVFPAPPPYSSQFGAEQAPPTHFAPPPGPPPPITSSALNSAQFQPPPLSQAPPVYEPFSFADEFAADQRRRQWCETGGVAADVHLHQAPRWHSPPVYDVYYESSSSAFTVHIALPSTLPPCACGSDFVCRCGRRRPAVWHASKAGLSAKRKISLLRLSPCSGSSTRAMLATRSGLFSSNAHSVHDERDRKVTEIAPSTRGRSFTL